jgi:hypothetical protein
MACVCSQGLLHARFPHMSRIIILLAVAFSFCCLDWMKAEEAILKPDPIVGEWRWLGNRDVFFDADGKGNEGNAGKAVWKVLNTNNTVERKYEITWKRSDGKIYIDTMILSSDGNRLEGRNQSNRRVWAKRIP